MASGSGVGGGTGGTPSWRWWVAATVRVARRPRLWSTALRQLVRLAPRGWWRRAPFVPRPDPGYLRFRLETAYGVEAPGDPDDLVRYLEWVRQVGARPRGVRRP